VTATVLSAPAVTPAESGFESDDLSQTEKEHRRAMEYLEPEEPGVVLDQVREANVLIPNIPVPTSSDGEVCNIVSLFCGCTLNVVFP
jgi:RNA polymerase-associated protein LEO1